MQRDIEKVSKSIEICPIFNGLSLIEISEFLNCSKYFTKSYGKGEIIISQGESIFCIGILISGTAQAIKLDHHGNQILAAHIKSGQLFADILAVSSDNKSPVTIVTAQPCAVCFIPWENIIKRCDKNCTKHTELLQNLVSIFSHKFFELFDRIDCLSSTTLRDKILTFLEKYSLNCSGEIFYLPFDRQQMANYLAVDRSALSRELGKMRDDGILEFDKNAFRFLINS